jgi:hypothetical protein
LQRAGSPQAGDARRPIAATREAKGLRAAPIGQHRHLHRFKELNASKGTIAASMLAATA